ncbi:PQQ-binding-like beta-propeller repeat protein [Halobacteriales archaeon Cl-PHB]
MSKQIYALRPDGEVLWETDKNLGKFKQDSLAVDDELVVGCGYDGQIVALDRKTGAVRWNFTDGRFATWTTQPLITDKYVVGTNVEESLDEKKHIIYFLERESGNVVRKFSYGEDAYDQEEPLRFGGISDVDRLGKWILVNCRNYIELYDAGSLEQVNQFSEFLFGWAGTVYDTDWLSISPGMGRLTRYDIDSTSVTRIWSGSTRGDPYEGPIVAGDAAYTSGSGGLSRFSLETGKRQWWGETDRRVHVEPTVTSRHVWVVDDLNQLYGFRREDGNQVLKKTLPADNSVHSLEAIGNRVLVATKPITVYSMP